MNAWAGQGWWPSWPRAERQDKLGRLRQEGHPAQNRGMMEVGASMVRMGWNPAGLSVHLPLLSSPCFIKSRMMTESHNTFQ